MALMGLPLYLLYESASLLIRLLPQRVPATADSAGDDENTVTQEQGSSDAGQGSKTAGGTTFFDAQGRPCRR